MEPHTSGTILHLFNETEESIPFDKPTLQHLAKLVEEGENCKFTLLETVVVDEDHIVRVNQQYLDRDYVTDIISFRYDEEQENNQNIEGTLYCCWPRIREQAQEFGETPDREFRRIVIHGMLHLSGYEDQSSGQKTNMTEKENLYLSRFESE